MATRTSAHRGLRVADLASEVGISPDAVRYYERAGLLPPPARTPAGYRSYDESAVDRLRFIQGAQRLGLRLRDIADLLAVRDTGMCPCEPAEQLLRRRIDEIDAEMARRAARRLGGDDRQAAIRRLPRPRTGHLVPAKHAWREVNRRAGLHPVVLLRGP